ncbi:MAG: multimeric flavodoxin WrbA [Desulforhopalus sp.]
MRDKLKKRVLVVYYSFTQQTRILLKQFCAGLKEEDVDVYCERIEPINPYEFPFQSNLRLVSVMVRTFFRGRKEVRPVSDRCFEDWDYVVLAGPTWSYQPSGPMLDFLDRYGESVLRGKKVIPIISCRSYWKIHHMSLQRVFKKVGAEAQPPLVFEHPMKEPYRVIGLLLKLRGKMIRHDWFRKHYEMYGHNKVQTEQAYRYGVELGQNISQD